MKTYAICHRDEKESEFPILQAVIQATSPAIAAMKYTSRFLDYRYDNDGHHLLTMRVWHASGYRWDFTREYGA